MGMGVHVNLNEGGDLGWFFRSFCLSLSLFGWNVIFTFIFLHWVAHMSLSLSVFSPPFLVPSL